MIDRSFIDRIEELSKVEMLEVGGRPYATKKLSPVFEPQPDALTISTLTGLADYINANADNLVLEGVIVHIESHASVKLLSVLEGGFKQRSSYLHVQSTLKPFNFGQWTDVERFIISLQSQFEQDAMTAALLRLVGNLQDGAVRNFSDDGVTQSVTAKTGIARVGEVEVPNPITLAPFRTFLEIAQPDSRFVFRLKQGDGMPLCALFEADGGSWQLEAIKRIRDWLRVHIPEEVTILA